MQLEFKEAIEQVTLRLTRTLDQRIESLKHEQEHAHHLYDLGVRTRFNELKREVLQLSV